MRSKLLFSAAVVCFLLFPALSLASDTYDISGIWDMNYVTLHVSYHVVTTGYIIFPDGTITDVYDEQDYINDELFMQAIISLQVTQSVSELTFIDSGDLELMGSISHNQVSFSMVVPGESIYKPGELIYSAPEMTYQFEGTYYPENNVISGTFTSSQEPIHQEMWIYDGDKLIEYIYAEYTNLVTKGIFRIRISGGLSVNVWTSGHFITCSHSWCDSASVPVHVQVLEGNNPVMGAEIFFEDTLVGQTNTEGLLDFRWSIKFTVEEGEYTATMKAKYKGIWVESPPFIVYNAERLNYAGITETKTLTKDEADAYNTITFYDRLIPTVPSPPGWWWDLYSILTAYFLRGYIPHEGDIVRTEIFKFTAPDVAIAWAVRDSVERDGVIIFENVAWTESENSLLLSITGGNIAMNRRAIMTTIASPVKLYVTSPNGTHAGYDPSTNELVYDFAIAISKPGDKPFGMFIPHPIEGEYIFSVCGTERGGYTLSVQALDSNGLFGEESSFSPLIEEDQIHSYKIMMPEKGDITVTPLGEIEFAYVPPFGRHDDLSGRIWGVNPDDYKVAVYIYVPPYGWWTKPYASQPLTSIASDGTWICDITTNGNDPNAAKIIVFLVPNGYNPPLGEGQQCLASELYQYPYAEAMRYEKISFSGYDWWVKRAYDPVGPGPNYFSDSEENVWVDPNGHLHLRIAQRDGEWYCSEVIAEPNLGYGKYIFTVKGRVDLLDQNIVLGLFTWEDCVPQYNYREIDIELSRTSMWRESPTDTNNAQFVVQPWDTSGNRYRFKIDLAGHPNETTAHEFTWQPNRISFQSYHGDFSSNPLAEDIIVSWHYTGGDTPPAAGENPRINFWLINGYAPTDGQDAEIMIESFQYLPIGDFCGPNFGPPDEYVDVWDLMQFADHWHMRTGEGNWDSEFDLAGPSFGDPDGYVDVWDLMVFADHWHEGQKP